MPPQDEERAADRQLESELKELQRERAEIISGHATQASAEMARFQECLAGKLQAAADARDYQRANLQLHFDLEKKHAWDEYLQGKSRLRDQVIHTHVERKKRLDAVKLGLAKRRKRSRVPATSPIKAAAAAAAAAATVAAAAASTVPVPAPPRVQLAGALEAQGLVRVSLAPDEVNRDLALILARVDQARAAGGSQAAAARAADAAAGSSGAIGAASRKMDAIHSSRGILHFHNEVFEKGDSIIAFAPGKPSSPKYAGVIMSLNGKEIMVRSHRANADGKQETNRVYVSHLRKNTINIAHAPAAH